MMNTFPKKPMSKKNEEYIYVYNPGLDQSATSAMSMEPRNLSSNQANQFDPMYSPMHYNMNHPMQMPMQMQQPMYGHPMMQPAMTSAPLPFMPAHTGILMPEMVTPIPHVAAPFDHIAMMSHPMMMQQPLTARDTLSNLQGLNNKHCAACGDKI